MVLPSTKQILYEEQQSRLKSQLFWRAMLGAFLLWVIVRMSNLYFKYYEIFRYFSLADAKLKPPQYLGPPCQISPWRVVMALEYPIFSDFTNKSTPIIVRELIRQVSCLNKRQCNACLCYNKLQACDPNSGGDGNDGGKKEQCETCTELYCQMQPIMFCGNSTSIVGGAPAPGNWNNSSNIFQYLIPASAPIVPGAKSPFNTVQQTEFINVLLEGGFLSLSESTMWTLGEFWGNVFSGGSNSATCTPKYTSYITAIAGGVLQGGMGGAMIGEGPGAIIGALLFGGLAAFSDKKDVCL